MASGPFRVGFWTPEWPRRLKRPAQGADVPLEVFPGPARALLMVDALNPAPFLAREGASLPADPVTNRPGREGCAREGAVR